MPYIKTSDDIQLYYEETGEGEPIIFVHEFGGDMRSWEPQMRYFARRHRCIAFNARGYPPSDVPDDLERYSQRRAALDVVDVLTALDIPKAHIVGLSMGGFATLHVGLIAPDRALSLVVAGAGYGAEKEHEAYFRDVSLEVAAQFEKQGAEAFSKTYALAASRIAFLLKDPRGWDEFAEHLSQHSAKGAAMTMRGVQARRPSLYDLADEFKAMTVPTLIVVGDEDDHCLQPGIFLKQTIPASGLAVLPKAGHTLNLEEPALFNQVVADFLASVSQNRWLPRDPRAQPSQIMKTS
ncbi:MULTISPECIES: alpha/beta fold hydrolase [unclassified Bordetella]|uniref:alpha/beta fold hydrolase n=1 Tax=unclassified Bordetella TaxID=2630031 RepID=UPI001327CFF5|nr:MULTISPECIES: alpha/beta hydrolase [unclassified Bordetella]MVW71118.1 alpha/beta fold hydrolase [Bordetella sp. 15P40C-2]MVW80687.1 alpha/beta fold hydrolase [Bordetella sp. 02P26C-1]